MITDNGIEYDDVKVIEFDEKQAVLIATEYYFKNELVRRDVHAKLKSLDMFGENNNG